MNKQLSTLRYLAAIVIVALIVVWFVFFPVDRQLAKLEQGQIQAEVQANPAQLRFVTWNVEILFVEGNYE